MFGKIKAYSDDVSAGIILGDDRRQYLFDIADWTSDIPPANNMFVDFKENHGHAVNIRNVK